MNFNSYVFTLKNLLQIPKEEIEAAKEAMADLGWSSANEDDDDEEDDDEKTRWKYRGKYGSAKDPFPGCSQYYNPTPWERVRVMNFVGRNECPPEVRTTRHIQNLKF